MLAPHAAVTIPGEQTPLARYGMFLLSMGLLLIVILIWFVLSCRNNGKSGRYRDDRGPRHSNEMQGYGDFQGVRTNDDDEDDSDDESLPHKRR